MELEEELTAWHEAGHAMMAVLCGGEIERVTIEPPDDDGPARFGDTVTRWRGLSNRQLVEAEIRVSLAGPIAEMIYRGERAVESVPEWAADWNSAREAAMSLCTNQTTAKRLLKSVVDEIYDLMDSANTWAAVSAIADDLLAHETLDHEQVAYSVDFWNQR
jgi:ATP-dependent Zn protease